MIADRRVSTKSYGEKILQSLPPMPVTNDAKTAIEFAASV
jgi:Rad3-related DNA helicase